MLSEHAILPPMSAKTFTPIATARLRLRRFRTDDAKALAAYRSDAEIARYQGWEAGYTQAQAEAFVHEMAVAEPGEPGGWFQVAIADPATDALLGDCVLHPHADDPAVVEVGYTLAPAHQGHGYATEAVAAIAAYAFSTLGAECVRAVTDARNTASIAVAERIGMTRVSTVHTTFKGERCMEYVYELARE
jgi:RimJ/RimL family protein N-acetyltransferase